MRAADGASGAFSSHASGARSASGGGAEVGPRSETATYALELDDVTFSYRTDDEARALAGVTFTVPKGQCVVLTGSSGCGKTTVTRLVNGLIPLAYEGVLSGSVTIAGTPLLAWSADELCLTVGSVFQNPRSQFFNLDTTSEVAFGCENLGLEREDMHMRVDAAFRALGAECLKDRDIFALSGGQRQMVAIAAACAVNPDILVLDEPTASLDVAAMRRLAQALARLKALGKTIIIAEHRLWWLSGIADRVVVMETGHVALDCAADALAQMSDSERSALGLRVWDMGGQDTMRRGGGCLRSREAALEVFDVRAAYARGPAVLKGASASFARGTITALIGENGAGKTTFARCIVGLHRESAGSVRFGTAVPKPKDRPKHAYLVMQETGYQLFSDSVRGELESAFSHAAQHSASSGAGDAVDEALECFDLVAQADRHPLSLSGGQRQRLAIAAGLAQGAEVLVLDEPTSGLDFRNMRRVADELREACNGGICAIVVTHDYEFIAAACDEAAVLADGVIEEVLPVCDETAERIRDILGFDR